MDIALIYMASGFGRRFGSNKLLYELQGRPLYQWGLTHLQEAAGKLGHRIIVVSSHEEILTWCAAEQIRAVQNRKSLEGMAASLRLGVEAAAGAGAHAFFVADQPYLTAGTIVRFLNGFEVSGKDRGCFLTGGVEGNPAVFKNIYRGRLLALQGDRGARSLLRVNPEDVWHFTAAAEELRDIDTPEDVPLQTVR